MTVAELNEFIANGTICELIRVCEARQCKLLSHIADNICLRPEVRVVLLAGGSSSGKTTTTKRLATQLRVNEHWAVCLSTDDYFVGDERNPRDENGKLDYEHVNCVDIKRLAADVKALIAGDAIPERKFDFIKHEPTYTDKTLSLPDDSGMVLIEGIHALNPVLTEELDDRLKYRVYIDPKPSIDYAEVGRSKSYEARFLRRLVRDHQFRKVAPLKTLEMWPSVLAGEKKWIEPFRGLADMKFDSYLDYEVAVLKPYVGGLLERMRREIGELPVIMDSIRMIEPITAIDAIKVPGDSILRETIGDSQLEY